MLESSHEKRYRKLLISTSLVFAIGYGLTIFIFMSVAADSGNGGAFQAGFGALGFFITAPLVFVLGIGTFAYRCVVGSKIQKKFFYSYWIPLAMAFTPGLLPIHSYLKYDLKLFG